MRPRLVPPLPLEVEPEIRPSARVSTVARLLDDEPSQIRRMLARGDLEGHREGKRGVRIFLDSVAAWQARGTLKPTKSPEKDRPTPPPPRSRATQAAHRHAVSLLQDLGVMPRSGR